MENETNPQGLTVSYTPDSEDLVRGFRFAYGDMRRLRRWLRLETAVYLGVPCGLTVALPAVARRPIADVLVGLAAWLLLVVLFAGLNLLANRPLQRRRLLAALAERPDLLGEQRVTLDATGIRHRTALSETWLAWRLVTRVGDDDRCIFLVLGNTYLSIPKRAFATTAAAEEFKEAARRLWESAPGAV
jgi:hypothetical protein